jgi:hypothetical protein
MKLRTNVLDPVRMGTILVAAKSKPPMWVSRYE